MKTKELVIMALFVGIGAVLHLIVPGFGAGGIRPDFSLLMMFLGIILFPNIKNVLMIGVATGIISALTTTVPLGHIPNLIDKFITALVVYGIFLLIKKNRSIISNATIAGIGTLVSGTVFILSLAAFASLPGPMMAMFVAAVIPAAIINTVAMVVVYPIVSGIAKRSKIHPA